MGASGSRSDKLLALVLVATALTFAISVTFPFVGWDDPRYASANPLVLHPLAQGWRMLLTTPTLGYPQGVTVLSYALNHAVFGMTPWSFHLVNLALHLVNVALLARIAAALGLLPREAAIAAMIFALHPIVAEPVCWVTGRKDLLATSLLFGAAVVLLRGDRDAPFPSARRWVLAAAMCVVGMGAKPSVAVAAGVLFVVLAAARPLWSLRRLALVLAPLGAIGALVVAAAGHAQRDAQDMHARSLADAVLDVLGACTLQLQHLVWPVGLVPHYERDPGDPSLAAMIVGACVLLALAFVLVRSDKRGPIFAGLAVAIVSFAPMSNVLAVNRWTADSYMYLPLAGIAITVATATRGLVTDRIARVAWPALGAAMAFVALGQASTWRTPESVWQAVADRYPTSPIGYTELAKTFAWEGKRDEGTAAFVAVDVKFPEFESALAERADARLAVGDEARAVRLLERGVAADDLPSARRLWLAIVQRQIDPRETTRAILERSFDMDAAEMRRQIADHRVWTLVAEVLRAVGSDARAKIAEAFASLPDAQAPSP